jgi:hypothetical protein
MSEDPKNAPKSDAKAQDDAKEAKKPAAAKAEETVTISKSDLAAVLDAVKEMKEQLDIQNRKATDQEREIDILRDAANRSRLEASDKSHGKVGDQRPRGHLKMLEDKVVHHWLGRKESQVVAKNRMILKANSVVDEIINGHFITLDKDENGAPIEVIAPYMDYAKATEYAYFRVVDQVVKERQLPNGVTEQYGTWVIEFEDEALRARYGEVEIDSKFVNP